MSGMSHSDATDLPRYLSAGPVTLDVLNHELTGAGRRKRLDGATFALLFELMRRPSALVPSERLIAASFPNADEEPEDAAAALRQRISRVRQVLTSVGLPGNRLTNIYNEGYILAAEYTVPRAFEPSEAKALDRLLTMRPSIAAVVQELSQAETMQRVAA